MAEGLNKALLLGNLCADPELKFTQGGQAILRLRLATTVGWWDNKANERKEQTEYHTVTLFGKRAESLNKLLQKGSRIMVEGRITTRSWDDKNGGKRYATEVNADNVLLCDGKRDGGDRRPRREEPEQESFEDPDGNGQEGYF